MLNLDKYRRPAINKSGSDPFVRHYMARYAYNFIGKLDISREYIWLLIRFIPKHKKARLSAWMKAHKIEKGVRTGYLEAYNELSENVDEILMDIGRPIYSFTLKEFETRLLRLFVGWYKQSTLSKANKENPELKKLQAMYGCYTACMLCNILMICSVQNGSPNL
ncbi:MAG: hypothetical protein LC725_13165 [Lentisphaerae bacterium]|nr:hypothetical protein [Lentisphaerota bacterium]